jgi:outer membrane lipoprotein SlyB
VATVALAASVTAAGGVAGIGAAIGAGAGAEVVAACGAALAGGCSGDPQALTVRTAVASIIQNLHRIQHLLVTEKDFSQSSSVGPFGNRSHPATV